MFSEQFGEQFGIDWRIKVSVWMKDALRRNRVCRARRPSLALVFLAPPYQARAEDLPYARAPFGLKIDNDIR
jgi:hypothetical protein